MSRLSFVALAATVVLAGCQSSPMPPQGYFKPVCVQRAADAGRCNKPSNLNLYGVLIGAEGWN